MNSERHQGQGVNGVDFTINAPGRFRYNKKLLVALLAP